VERDARRNRTGRWSISTSSARKDRMEGQKKEKKKKKKKKKKNTPTQNKKNTVMGKTMGFWGTRKSF